MTRPPCRPSAETAQRPVSLQRGSKLQPSGPTQRVACCITAGVVVV